jgi:hypothetical protein
MLNKPPRPSVFLKNVGKNLFLNFITIEDEDHFNEQFPGNTLLEKIQEGDVNAVLSIFWRLLDNDGKRLIRDAKLVRWEGMEEKTVTTDDPIEKLRLIVSGGDEITAMMEAIFGVRAKSSPEPKLNEKKKLKGAAP